MALGTQDKELRGFYSQANADLSAPLNTRPTQASRQTTNAMDQQLRGMVPPLGMPKVAAPATPAAAGPITQMSQAAASNYSSGANQVETLPSAMPKPAQPIQSPAAPAGPRTYAEPVIPPDVLQRFAQLQSSNMGIQPQGQDFGTSLPTQQAQLPAANPLAGMRVSDTSMPDIKRVDGGSSPLFTNIDPAQAVQEMRGGTVNTLPASSFMVKGGATSQLAQGDPQGPSVGIIRNSDTTAGAGLQKMFQDYMRSMQSQAGRGRAGRNEMSELTKQFQAMTGAQLGEGRLGADQGNNAATQALRQQELSQRATSDQQRLGLDQQRLALDTFGAEGQQLQNQQAQMMMDLTRKAIGGDQDALRQLQALQGKNPKTPQSEALLEILKAYTTGQATALPGSGVPITQVMQDVAPLLQMLGGQAPAAAPAAPPADGTRGTLNGVRGVIRGGQFIPD